MLSHVSAMPKIIVFGMLFLRTLSVDLSEILSLESLPHEVFTLKKLTRSDHLVAITRHANLAQIPHEKAEIPTF